MAGAAEAIPVTQWFEVTLSYTYVTEAKAWHDAMHEAQALRGLPVTIKHPLNDRRIELEIDVGEGYLNTQKEIAVAHRGTEKNCRECGTQSDER